MGRARGGGVDGADAMRITPAQRHLEARAGRRLRDPNPKTVRKKVGDTYHGRLPIDVRRSTGLYRKIEGWAQAIMRRD
jgi:hypothetical protein